MINFFSIFNFFKKIKNVKLQEIYGPILIIIILSTMILPLYPIFLDILFTFNIFFSISVLLVSMFIKSTLEFTSFPTVLLFTTLLRLALNIASTRIILLYGHKGTSSAGNVIKSFGHFLVGNNLTIGIVIFIILVIINFVVITKGAGRIAEVSARFILDGMPGKQMSIDSDLNSGLIQEKEANKRRYNISREADFYGSMDGASKFVRGDAIAGILIMIINILGGLIIGLFQHEMSISKATKVYTLLTVGDGLVAQIPALIISTAAGVIVTRVESNKNISEQIIDDLFSNFHVIFLSGIILGIFGLIPGMPNIIFLLFSFLLFFVSWFLKDKNILLKNKIVKQGIPKNDLEISWKNINLEEYLSINLGSKLINLLNLKNKKNLLKKIFFVRKKYVKKFGFIPPQVKIKYNFNLLDNEYKIFIKGVENGSGKILINKYMAINSKFSKKKLSKLEVKEPVFGLQAFWIKKEMSDYAKKKGYTVVDSSTIIATHLDNLISNNLSELFGLQETQKLLNRVNIEYPQLIEGLIPETFSLTILNKVLRNLLFENISIKDMRTIIETLIEYSFLRKNIEELTNMVRISLGKHIFQKLFSNSKKIYVFGLSLKMENFLFKCLNDKNFLNPYLFKKLVNNVKNIIKKNHSSKNPLVFVVNIKLRYFFFNLLKPIFFNINVLSNLEIPNNKRVIFISLLEIL
ncbi:MAG: flagellar biosynthesis protein FlhA [Buchnera aphidicola (Periphyllus lyropictus)]|uniref:flagellar biosynthesis protein FlhA n=1 Tax=Buchnera aphidicola TaxID=9 RepID=UPI001EB4F876|nr:flagellar biosynthesis protein FlhA [Buchnera aphidicola]NIH16629.1 flagellar biosynthesis protein FlhA [Buchnera aphidicola (Periphyllus lyropictus)]USS94541.1 flagellar biosynthesis protein FlhA [Buchnera aphidicola (Periphyllus lyropictus)]